MATLYDLNYGTDQPLSAVAGWSNTGDLAFSSGQLSTAAGPGYIPGPAVSGGGGDIQGSLQYVSHSNTSGIIFAADATLDNGYLVYRRNSTGLVTLARRTGGVTSNITASTGDLPQGGLLEFKRYGSAIEVFVNGASVIFYSDPTPVNAGTHIGLFTDSAVTWSAGPTIADTEAPAGETGLRYLAPTVQGTGDGKSAANAGALDSRLSAFAGYFAWLVANDGGATAAAGLPPDCAVGIVLLNGSTYDDSAVGWPNSARSLVGTVFPADRKLCIVGATDAAGTIPAAQECITATPVVFEGGRTPDPRANKAWPYNTAANGELRYATNVVHDDATTLASVAVPSGQYYRLDTKALAGTEGTITLGTQGAFTLSGSGAGLEFYNFRFNNYAACFVIGSNFPDLTIRGCEASNLRQFIRNSGSATPRLKWLGARVFGAEVECSKHRGGNDVEISVDHVDGEAVLGNFTGLTVVDTSAGTGDVVGVTIRAATGGAGTIERVYHGVTDPGLFVQGDGLVTNEGVGHVTVTGLTIDDVGDGAVDVKPHAADPTEPALTVTNVAASKTKRSFRIWGDSIGYGVHNEARLTGCSSNGVTSAHIYARPRPGAPILLHVDDFTAVETNTARPFIKWDPATSEGVSHCEIVLRNVDVTGMAAACPAIVDSGNNNAAFVEAHSVAADGWTFADYDGTVATLLRMRKLATHASLAAAKAAGQEYLAVHITDEVEPTVTLNVNGAAYDGTAIEVLTGSQVTVEPVGGTPESVTAIPASAATVTDNGDGTWTVDV